MLIQPVEWHLKTVEEEVVVDETLHLLQDKHKEALARKTSQSNGGTQKPELANGNEKASWGSKKTLSNKELNGGKINKSDANGLNGK